MHERPAAPSRPTVSDSPPSSAGGNGRGQDVQGLSRAQARALARSAPLTPAEFRARGRVAETGVSLRALLTDETGTAAQSRGPDGS